MSEGPPSRHRWRSKAPSAQEQRRAMNRRRHSQTIQIRRQRKEALLQRKRRQDSSAISTVGVDTSNLLSVMDAYIQRPDGERLSNLQRAMTATGSQGLVVLQPVVEEDTSKALALVSQLSKSLESQDSSIQTSALAILLDLSSTAAPRPASDDYYGRAPTRWSSLLTDEPNLIPLLLGMLSFETRVASNILGNLVQDSPQALTTILPSWPTLVAHLPTTSYLCAAVVRQDATSLGTDFLQSLTVDRITPLLQNDETVREAAWIVEGLSRREDAAVDALCNDATLVSTILNRVYDGTVKTKKDILVPLLQAISNMTTACEGRYVSMFLSQQIFVDSLNRLLEQGIVLDAVSLAACLLADAGIPSHPSTNQAAPAFLPRLVSILTSATAVQEWKREAACAIYNAVGEPPGIESSSCRPEVSLILDNLLRDYFWDASSRDGVMKALLDLLICQDVDGLLAAIHILNRLLRVVPDSRLVFEGYSGVDSLEQVCDRAVGRDSVYLDEAAQVAANLIDDLFDNDDENEEEAVGSAPVIENNQFVFGAPFAGASAFDLSRTGPAGRGRGRTIPAWMQQSDS